MTYWEAVCRIRNRTFFRQLSHSGSHIEDQCIQTFATIYTYLGIDSAAFGYQAIRSVRVLDSLESDDIMMTSEYEFAQRVFADIKSRMFSHNAKEARKSVNQK